eukprot:2437442-Rhodomonas_salina.1
MELLPEIVEGDEVDFPILSESYSTPGELDRAETREEFEQRKEDAKKMKEHASKKRLIKLAREVKELVDAWDLSLEEVKAVALYTGPM